jgi:hypothetical protein
LNIVRKIEESKETLEKFLRAIKNPKLAIMIRKGIEKHMRRLRRNRYTYIFI